MYNFPDDTQQLMEEMLLLMDVAAQSIELMLAVFRPLSETA